MEYADIWKLAQAQREPLIAFTAKLVQTPSLPGHEEGVAKLIQAEMAHLGYDETRVDQAGNVIGLVSGGDGPRLMFNGHMDHVDAGDPARWPYPPFGAEIHDGAIWGRATVDMKGALAAMVYAGGLIKALGKPLPGDRYVTAVVQEEVGGLGTRHLARELSVARAVVGEASGNQLRRGHRGRVELVVHLVGRSAHAAMPALGVNPHFSMAELLLRLRTLGMVEDAEYGPSTVAPTRITSEPHSANVTPAAIHLVLDWRNIPSETPEEILHKLETLLADSLAPGCTGRVEMANKELVSYTGFTMCYPDSFPSFATTRDLPWLEEACAVLSAALGRAVEIGTWHFATDGGHLAAAGATVIGFGPGDDALVHTTEERLNLDDLVESVVGYAALALQP